MEFTAAMIAGYLQGETIGDPEAKVWTVAKIEEGTEGSLSFLANPKYEPHIYTTGSSIVIVNDTFVPEGEVKATLIKVKDAYACFAKLLELYASAKPRKTGIAPTASVSSSATLGKDCYVGEYAVIADGAVIGDNCSVYPHTYIGDKVRTGNNCTFYSGVKIYEECVVGNNVVIHSGAVVGSDGFGFAPGPDGTFSKIPQLGNVVIEDDVEIGSNTTVDRATMGSTVLRRGVKLDNLIQIGHNVVVGENTVMASQCGIAGSTKIGANCMFGGQVGIAGHLDIGDNVKIGSASGVSNSIPANSTYFGYPAQPAMKHHRLNAYYRNLPKLNEQVDALKKRVAELEQGINGK